MDATKIQYARNYSLKEFILRFLWALCFPFFRFSPRLFYSWRNVILRLYGAKIGKHVKIYPSANIMFPWNLEIGDYCVISWGVKIYNLGFIKIGAKTIISQYTHLCAGTHDHESENFELVKSEISIGSQVWIAADAFIGPGVIIGDKAVAAARAVVVKQVEPSTMVAGNPARVVKRWNTTKE